MTAAVLLTALALAGVALGLLLGQSRLFSSYLAAASGGLLFGISVFWLLPEIAVTSGWLAACSMTAAAGLVLALVDRLFAHSGPSSGRLAIGPILAATALHGFLDGWSVRALGNLQMANMAAPIGLALHKIPEGVAIGWVSRHSFKSQVKAAIAATAVELFTVVGAYVEPQVNRSGLETFGAYWTSAVVAVISGSFLFLGLHAIVPNRRRLGVMLVFAGTLALVATIGLRFHLAI